MDRKEFNDFVSLRCLHVHPLLDLDRPLSRLFKRENRSIYSRWQGNFCDEDKNIITR